MAKITCSQADAKNSLRVCPRVLVHMGEGRAVDGLHFRKEAWNSKTDFCFLTGGSGKICCHEY